MKNDLMKNNLLKWFRRTGFGLAEVVVTVVIGVSCAIPLIWMVSSSRTETTQAINYLRAMELANEIIDLANVVPFKDLDSFAGAANGRLSPFIQVKQLDPGHAWFTYVADQNLPYSGQYDKCYFYRQIDVKLVDNQNYSRFLKKLSVSVEWNEAKVPPNPNVNTADNQRMRKIVLETLVFNDLDPEY